MPRHYNSRRSSRRSNTSNVYGIEKRTTIAMIVLIMFMFALTPFLIVYNKNSDTGSSSSSSGGSTTSETVNSVLSTSGSDILTSPSSVSSSMSSTSNTIGSIMSNNLGNAAHGIISDSLQHIRLHE